MVMFLSVKETQMRTDTAIQIGLPSEVTAMWAGNYGTYHLMHLAASIWFLWQESGNFWAESPACTLLTSVSQPWKLQGRRPSTPRIPQPHVHLSYSCAKAEKHWLSVCTWTKECRDPRTSAGEILR